MELQIVTQATLGRFASVKELIVPADYGVSLASPDNDSIFHRFPGRKTTERRVVTLHKTPVLSAKRTSHFRLFDSINSGSSLEILSCTADPAMVKKHSGCSTFHSCSPEGQNA